MYMLEKARLTASSRHIGQINSIQNIIPIVFEEW